MRPVSVARRSESLAATVVLVAGLAVPAVALADIARRVARSGELSLSSLTLEDGAVIVVSAVLWGILLVALLSWRSMRIPLVPFRIQRALRRVVDLSAFGVGGLGRWTASNPSAAYGSIRVPATLEQLAALPPTAPQPSADRNADRLSGRTRSRANTATVKSQPTTAKHNYASVVDHVVSRGDTYWSLAATHLGDGKRWSEIRDLNLGRRVAEGVEIDVDSTLRSGWIIAVPTVSEVKRSGRGKQKQQDKETDARKA